MTDRGDHPSNVSPVRLQDCAVPLPPAGESERPPPPRTCMTVFPHLTSRPPTSVEPWSDFGDARTERRLSTPRPGTGHRAWPSCDRHQAPKMPRPGCAGVPPAPAGGRKWTPPPQAHRCVQAGKPAPAWGRRGMLALPGERPSMTPAPTRVPAPAPTLGTPAPACYRLRRSVPDDAPAAPRRTRA